MLRGFPEVQPQHVMLGTSTRATPQKKKKKKKSLALTDLLGKAKYLQRGSSWLRRGAQESCAPAARPSSCPPPPGTASWWHCPHDEGLGHLPGEEAVATAVLSLLSDQTHRQQPESAGVPPLPGRTAASLLGGSCTSPPCSTAGCPPTRGCRAPAEGPAVSGNGWDVEMESSGRAWAEGCDGARGAPRAGVGRAPGGDWTRDGEGRG